MVDTGHNIIKRTRNHATLTTTSKYTTVTRRSTPKTKLKKKIIFYIKYYRIIPLTMILIFCITFNGTLADCLRATFEINRRNPLYDLMQPLILLITLAPLAKYTFTTFREKRYRFLTGRSFSKDHNRFKKDYHYLVQFFTHNDPYKMNIEELPEEDWHLAEGVILGKVKDKYGNYRLIKRPSREDGSLLCLGIPGSGKTSATGMPTAIRFNANYKGGGRGVFAISIKGDLLNFVRGKRAIKVFTPDREQGSCHFNPLYGVDKMNWTDRKKFAENIATIINPDEAGDSSTFFVEGARDYAAGTILYLLHLHDTGELPGKLTFPEIIETILRENVFELTLKIQSCGNPIPGEYTNGYIGSNEKNTASIWSHLCKNSRPLISGALKVLFDGKGDCITPQDLNKADVYVDVPQDKFAIYSKAISIIVSTFLQAEMVRPDVSSAKKVVPHLYLLDEFVQLHLPYDQVLAPALMTLRSKKTSLFMLLQSVASLESCYGESRAREIIDLCAYISVFNAQDPKSREYFQKLVGQREMLKESTSISTSSNNQTAGTNASVTKEYIFDAADFGNLNTKDPKTGKVIKRVLIYANGKYCLAETTPCYE